MYALDTFLSMLTVLHNYYLEHALHVYIHKIDHALESTLYFIIEVII